MFWARSRKVGTRARGVLIPKRFAVRHLSGRMKGALPSKSATSKGSQRRPTNSGFLFVMSIADHPVQADELAKKLRTTKFVRWVNPFIKALGETPSPVPTTRRVPDGTRVYCVGDIHGRDDLLGEMAERVKADMEGRSFDHVVTVFLGDYVDRGFGSMRVLERLSRSEWPTPMIALAGNHEELLMAFLEDEGSWKLGAAWAGSKPCIPTASMSARAWSDAISEEFKRHSRRVSPNTIATSWKRSRFRRPSAITSSVMPE